MIGALILSSLVIVQPGQTKVVRFFGSYVGTVRRTGPVVDRAAGRPPEPEHPGQELRDQPSEGQRRRRQPGGDRRDRRLAGRRHLAGRRTRSMTTSTSSQVQAESALRHVATTHPYDDPGGRRHLVARLDRRRRRRARPGGRPAGRDRRGRDRRGAHQPSRIRPGDRAGDAPPPAGQRRRRRPLPDRRGRRGNGRDGPRALEEQGIVELDEERKAAMVSNLLVVLCGDQPASPVVNTGSLYT